MLAKKINEVTQGIRYNIVVRKNIGESKGFHASIRNENFEDKTFNSTGIPLPRRADRSPIVPTVVSLQSVQRLAQS